MLYPQIHAIIVVMYQPAQTLNNKKDVWDAAIKPSAHTGSTMYTTFTRGLPCTMYTLLDTLVDCGQWTRKKLPRSQLHQKKTPFIAVDSGVYNE